MFKKYFTDSIKNVNIYIGQRLQNTDIKGENKKWKKRYMHLMLK